MNDNYQSRKNCLQWGLRILSPTTYFALLKRYAIELSPDAFEQIEKAHTNKRGGCWWYQWLTCDVLQENMWINMATGRAIADWHWNKVATFPSWEAYESFREELRELTAKRLRANPHLF